jgi:hypothetical protein
MKSGWKLVVLSFSVIILYVSFVRAGLERLKENKSYDILRNVPIYFQTKNDLGEFQNYCYKLPETNTLPDSPLYFIKNIRDEFWVDFSKEPLEKANILLLIADKNMEEAIKLDKKGKNNLANETVKESILKLEKSKKIVNSLNQSDIEVMKMNNKIDEAARVYKYLIEYLQLGNDVQDLFINSVEKC